MCNNRGWEQKLTGQDKVKIDAQFYYYGIRE